MGLQWDDNGIVFFSGIMTVMDTSGNLWEKMDNHGHQIMMG